MILMDDGKGRGSMLAEAPAVCAVLGVIGQEYKGGACCHLRLQCHLLFLKITRQLSDILKLHGSIHVFFLHALAQCVARMLSPHHLLQSAVVSLKQTSSGNGLPFISSICVHQSSLSRAIETLSGLVYCRGTRGTRKSCFGVCRLHDVSHISLQYMSPSTWCSRCAAWYLLDVSESM